MGVGIPGLGLMVGIDGRQARDDLRAGIVTCSLAMKMDNIGFVIVHTSSGAQELAREEPDAAVVSAPGGMPSEVLSGVSDARDKSPRPGMVYCGDNADAKEVFKEK